MPSFGNFILRRKERTKMDRKQLISLIDAFRGTPVLVLGDLILDQYIWGRVKRVSPEAPVVVVEVTEEDKRPGGAGNVIHNLVSLGAKVSVCGVVGDDPAGRDLTSLFQKLGVDTEGIFIGQNRPTTIKTRVIAHAQQVVRVDKEVTDPLPDALIEKVAGAAQAKIKNVSGIAVSDYAKGGISLELLDRLRVVRGAGGAKSGIPWLVDPKAPNFPWYTEATVIKPNRSEAQEASGVLIRNRADAMTAGRALRAKWKCGMVLITLGEDGMVLVSQGDAGKDAFEVETEAREVYDVSGAGDTVSAVFLLTIASGGTPLQAAQLANAAAGIVVAEVGTVAVTADALRAVVSGER